jgi:hypothetical protein
MLLLSECYIEILIIYYMKIVGSPKEGYYIYAKLKLIEQEKNEKTSLTKIKVYY